MERRIHEIVDTAAARARTAIYPRLSEVESQVALTFDDCNSAGAWERILDILGDGGLKATFFPSGPNVERFPELARRTALEGHSVGSHGWGHRRLIGVAESEIAEDLRSDLAAWARIDGVLPTPYFRPPYGAYDANTLAAAAAAGFTRVITWDVEPRDWTRPAAGRVAEHVARSARGGSFIVLHALEETARDLPQILTALRDKKLRPCSLDDLFAGHDAG